MATCSFYTRTSRCHNAPTILVYWAVKSGCYWQREVCSKHATRLVTRQTKRGYEPHARSLSLGYLIDIPPL